MNLNGELKLLETKGQYNVIYDRKMVKLINKYTTELNFDNKVFLLDGIIKYMQEIYIESIDISYYLIVTNCNKISILDNKFNEVLETEYVECFYIKNNYIYIVKHNDTFNKIYKYNVLNDFNLEAKRTFKREIADMYINDNNNVNILFKDSGVYICKDIIGGVGFKTYGI